MMMVVGHFHVIVEA